jgi:flavorubredoxin
MELSELDFIFWSIEWIDMRRDPIVLYENGQHKCLMFADLVEGEGVQSNQFFIEDHGETMLLDPGGDLTYMPLSFNLGRYTNVRNLKYIFASHQDPDIISALDKWLLHTHAKAICSKLWSRFLPHLTANYLKINHGVSTFDRIIPLPDRGDVILLGRSRLQALPAHFLHSVGNFQIYDPVSRILFSGDMGASMTDSIGSVQDFSAHIPLMEGFHRRYMVSRKVCALWAHMVRRLDVEMIVPQHGQRFEGKVMIDQFLNWIEHLDCGVDLLNQRNYMPLE